MIKYSVLWYILWNVYQVMTILVVFNLTDFKWAWTLRNREQTLAIKNHNFKNCIHDIYPKVFKLTKFINNNPRASFLHLYITLENDSLHTKIYDKRDTCNFVICYFLFLNSDIPEATLTVSTFHNWSVLLEFVIKCQILWTQKIFTKGINIINF